ncbi:MAG: LLM class F420-dependent oxidoreductase, partial [Actinobacteria bacterium]|nr:LLM class F420-dependent oxidoreductase [Actinomycetota bacterium]
AAVPRDFLDRSNLVGPESVIRERLGSWKAAGVTHLNVSLPGPDAAATLGQLREILADV